MTKIVIFGGGKIAEVVHACISGDCDLSIAGFTCDRAFVTADAFHGLPLVPFDEVVARFPPGEFAMFIAVGYQGLNALRAERCKEARDRGYRLMSWVSPRAHVPAGCAIGENCLVMDGASLQPYARLGDGVFVWNNAVVGHHAAIGDYCWLASNCTISSTVVVEPFCFFGVNAAIGHAITIGARILIGAGAVVTRDATAGGVYIRGDTERFRLDSERFMKFARMT
jgi:sugar O-acyltransferase (sialic acid O-acetyltransferase NeuD family)